MIIASVRVLHTVLPHYKGFRLYSLHSGADRAQTQQDKHNLGSYHVVLHPSISSTPFTLNLRLFKSQISIQRYSTTPHIVGSVINCVQEKPILDCLGNLPLKMLPIICRNSRKLSAPKAHYQRHYKKQVMFPGFS